MRGGITEALSGLLGLTSKPSIATSPNSLVAWAGPDSVGPGRPSPESVQRRYPRHLEHHTPLEHAVETVKFIQRNDLNQGMIFADGMKEFYTEAIIELGWAPRPWNPIARQIDLLCTGGQKPYAWAMDDRGRMRRRRHYPIPADVLADVAPATERRAA